MKRRDFIKQSALAGSLAFVPNILNAFNGFSSKSLNGKKLVLIQLAGGNDGLNTRTLTNFITKIGQISQFLIQKFLRLQKH